MAVIITGERTTISWSRDFSPINDIHSSWDSWTEVQAPEFRKRSSFTVSDHRNEGTVSKVV